MYIKNSVWFQVAVRHLATRSAKTHKIEITREQLDLFSLKVLATACISVANASARTAVLIAFGKANLVSLLIASLCLHHVNVMRCEFRKFRICIETLQSVYCFNTIFNLHICFVLYLYDKASTHSY